MSATNLGNVSIVPKGDYDALTQYNRLNVVTYNRNAYQAKTDVIGVTPGTDATKWMLLVEGATGLPDAPTSDGTYTLKVVVSSGTPTYSWVADT